VSVVRSRYGRRLVLVSLVVIAVFGGIAQRAGAAPPPRPYTPALSTASAAAGSTVSETLTLTNKSLVPLGSAKIAIPSGYTAVVGTVTGPPVLPFLQTPRKNWSATNVSGVIQLSASNVLNSLLYNETVRVTLSVRVPCVAPLNKTWVTQASGSIPFLPLSGFASTGDPSISATGSCSFRFDPISTQAAGTAIAAHVQTLDGNGVPTGAFGGSAALSGTFSSTHGAPTITSPLSFSNGVANGSATTFTAETGRTLTATDAVDGIAGTSNAFDVNPGPAFSLKFDTEPPAPPAETAVNTAIAPAMTVDVFDQWGNAESVPGLNQVPVTLSIVTDPYGGTTLGGTTTQTSVAGVATFGDIQLNHGGNGFTVLAASGGLGTDTSTGFNIFDAICTGTCTATNPDGNTTVTASGNGTTIQMGPTGAAFNCGTTFAAIGSIVTINPAPGFTALNPLSVTLQFSPSVAPTSTALKDFHLCITKDGTNYSQVPECRKLQNNGDNDADDVYQDSDLPCIFQKSRLTSPSNLNNYLQLILLMTSTDPGAGLH
jgi:hypothetical protein